MWEKLVLKIIKELYAQALRKLVVAAIDNPDSTIDDFALSLLDKLLDYGGK